MHALSVEILRGILTVWGIREFKEILRILKQIDAPTWSFSEYVSNLETAFAFLENIRVDLSNLSCCDLDNIVSIGQAIRCYERGDSMGEEE